MLWQTTSIKIADPFQGESSEKWPQFTLIGRSRAGEGTSFAIPELKWVFDCGAVVQGWKASRIFLSHTHCDHVDFLSHHLNEESPPTVYLPAESTAHVERYLEARHAMINCMTNNVKDEVVAVELKLESTKPDEEIVFRQGRSEYVCRTVACHHRIPCLGFSIFKRTFKLKQEYLGLPGSEIGKLKREGVDVTESQIDPFICFLGDTTHLVFEQYPDLLRKHKVVVVECSFIAESDVARAEETRHMHWQELRPYIESNRQVLFVLIHFTLKEKSLDLLRFFQEKAKYRNIHPMLLEKELDREWAKLNAGGDRPTCSCFMCCPPQKTGV